MRTKLKTYVLIVSEFFQSKHPRKGESTHFYEKILKTTTEHDFYPCLCLNCGYLAMSNNFIDGEQIADTGDYEDPYCPHCQSQMLEEQSIKDFIEYYQLTDDIEEKLHTIRGNYELWKKRIDEVIAGKAILSIRGWIGKPYNSKQIEIARITKENNPGIQKVYIDIHCDESNIESSIRAKVEEKEVNASLLAKNDGLNIIDFSRWFFPDLTGCFTGGIIHFTGFRY